MPSRKLVSLLFVCALTACSVFTPPEPTATPDPVLVEGRKIFNQNCATCHALVPETVIVGPSLAGVATRAETRMPNLDARGYIELSILKPEAYLVLNYTDVMPKNFGKTLTGAELDTLVTFLLTQK